MGINYFRSFEDVDPIRSRTMSCIRSEKNRSTEWRLRAILVNAGIRGWHMHPISIKGKPDFVFEKQKLAIFVDGCFWHGCKICYRRPKSRQKYWDLKLVLNRKRDHKVNRILKQDGYHILRFWEHDIEEHPKKLVKKILDYLNKS